VSSYNNEDHNINMNATEPKLNNYESELKHINSINLKTCSDSNDLKENNIS